MKPKHVKLIFALVRDGFNVTERPNESSIRLKSGNTTVFIKEKSKLNL